LGEGGKVVAEDLDGSGWVAGRLPSGEVLSIGGWEFVVFVGVPVGYSLGSIADRADERDKKSWEGCSGVVAKTEATTF
jgi:hypothetical protein